MRVAVNVFAMKGVADGSVAVTVVVLDLVGVVELVGVLVSVVVLDLVRVFDGTNPGMVAVPVVAGAAVALREMKIGTMRIDLRKRQR